MIKLHLLAYLFSILSMAFAKIKILNPKKMNNIFGMQADMKNILLSIDGNMYMVYILLYIKGHQ